MKILARDADTLLSNPLKSAVPQRSGRRIDPVLTTVHGLRGHGAARAALAEECRCLSIAALAHRVPQLGQRAEMLGTLVRAVESLPGDVSVLPQDQRCAARRLKASIGNSWRADDDDEEGSPFLLHKRTLAAVDELFDALLDPAAEEVELFRGAR